MNYTFGALNLYPLWIKFRTLLAEAEAVSSMGQIFLQTLTSTGINYQNPSFAFQTCESRLETQNESISKFQQ